jgi:hypothetical protein
MRHVTSAVVVPFVAVVTLVAGGLGGGRAFATPFEPRTVPDKVEVVGHLDVDALRKTQIFAAVGGQAAIDAALDQAPPEFRPLARSLAQAIRGVSFWRDTEHGALYVETKDSRSLAQLVGKLPVKSQRSIDGVVTYTMGEGDKHGFGAVFGDTLVLADSAESLEASIHVLGGKAGSLAGSNKLPSASRQGVFVFVTIGDNMLGAIQKAAHSKVLQLAIRSLVVDVGEATGVVTANARAEMQSADALQKARSILDGLRALASLSDEPAARTLLDGVTVTANGLALEVVAKLPVAELAKMIQEKHERHEKHEKE